MSRKQLGSPRQQIEVEGTDAQPRDHIDWKDGIGARLVCAVLSGKSCMSGSVDVAIIGCGPVGALAANLCGKAGLSTLVIDRENGPHPSPRAVHLDHEMMRLFQAVDLIEPIRSGMRETQGHLHVGADRGVIRYMGTAGRPKPFGWANDYFFYQPELEQWLREGIARFDTAELRLGTELIEFAQNSDGVTLSLEQAGERQQVSARYVIACDGARSTTRSLLGITLDDLDFEEPWLVVDVEVHGKVRFPDLWGVPSSANLQELSVMICDPIRPATIVPGRGSIRRWEFMVLPGEEETAIMQPAAVAALLDPYLDGVPHRVVRASTYHFHGLVAARWQVGRVFLAGDAAHQTPPFFGQGMCHGMRDAANLVWKIAAVCTGEAHARVLDTYQIERDPHVRAVVSASVEAGRYICELDPIKAAERDASMRAQPDAQTGTAADLIPALQAGIIATGTPGAGERFVQPAVPDGLLDDATGEGWRLFVRGQAAMAAASAALDVLPFDLAVIDLNTLRDGGVLADWLDARRAEAVLVRPDFYVFGTGDPAELINQVAVALSAGQEAVEW